MNAFCLFLVIIYFLLRIAYENGDFTISLDDNFAIKSGIVIYENKEQKDDKRMLTATKVDFMDNISVNWLPDNLDSQGDRKS